MKHLYIACVNTIYGIISDATPLLFKVTDVSPLAGASHSTPSCRTCVELDSILSMAGKQWCIPYAPRVIFEMQTSLSALSVAIPVYLPVCLYAFLLCGLILLFDYFLLFSFFDILCSLIPHWVEIGCVAQTCHANLGESCASPTERKALALYPWPM